MEKKKVRHWRPYTKLTITEAWQIKQIGRARVHRTYVDGHPVHLAD